MIFDFFYEDIDGRLDLPIKTAYNETASNCTLYDTNHIFGGCNLSPLWVT